MRITTTTAQRERGFSYTSVMITAIVVGLTLTAYLTLVSSQNQMTMRSQAWNRTVSVIEAGIEEALAHLNKNASANSVGIFNINMNTDGWVPAAGGGWTKTGQIGDDYYVVTIGNFSAGNYYPTIVSEGYVKQLPTFAMRNSGTFPFLAVIGSTTTTTSNSVPAGFTKRSVFCNTTNVPMWTKGIVARRTINLNGKNVQTDSFDSSIPAYNTNGRYDPTKARDNGDLASNDNIIGAVSVGNATIYGHVATGPRGTLGILNGGVGSRSWLANNGGKGVQPGWYRNDMNMEFPPVDLPFTSGFSPERDKDRSDGIRYNYVFGSGNYVVDGGMSGKVLVEGNARILVNGDISMNGNSDGFIIRPGASVSIWMNGATARFGGNGVVNGGGWGDIRGTGVATNFYYFGTTNNTVLDLGGNAEFTGAVYAPNANLALNGGGNNTTDFAGAAIVNSVVFNGHYNFHYDEALPKIGLYRGYVLTSWDEN